MDFRKLASYVDKSRINVFFFFYANELKIEKTECFSKKPEIMFNFWIAEKIQKHMKLIFLTRERKKGKLNIYLIIGDTASQKNSRTGLGDTKRSDRSRPIVLWEKIKL